MLPQPSCTAIQESIREGIWMQIAMTYNLRHHTILSKGAEIQWEHCVLKMESVSDVFQNGKALEAIRPETQKLSLNVIRVTWSSNADPFVPE